MLTWLREWRDRRRDSQHYAIHVERYVWHAAAIGGGGMFDTPELNRSDAIEYVTRRGTHSIAHVDDTHKYIFYRIANR
jgi:hypothetical protein